MENPSGQHIHIESITETVMDLSSKLKEKKLHSSILRKRVYSLKMS